MKLADNVRLELLYSTTNIIIPIDNKCRNEAISLWENLNIDNDKEIEITIKNKRQKRSLNANAYSWVLTDKLADKLRISKDECHELMLQRYGQTAKDANGQNIIISVLADIPIEALRQSLGYLAPIKEGFVGGKKFIHYRVLKGSSEFDTKEMTIFIDGIVSECKEQGIETMTPQELSRMLDSWKGEK